MKNLVDDSSFEELGRMIRDAYYLSAGIEERKKKINALVKEIKKEEKRLVKQGYNLRYLDTTIIKGISK